MSSSETENNVNIRDTEIFNEIRNYIRKKINNSFEYFEKIWPQKKQIMDIIQKSIELGESNSVIICGSPGSGKQRLVFFF